MNRRLGPIGIAVVILIVIGMLTRLMVSPTAFVIPVLVLGIIFLLYKYPPHRWKTPGGYTKNSGYGRYKTQRNRKFKVIQGNKRDDNDETPPPYH